jgi:hypothetical protein
MKNDSIILNPLSEVAGKSITEWTEDWFVWQLQSSTDANPSADPTGAFAETNNDGPVFFIAGTNGGSATRSFEAPSDTPILIPIINFFDTLDPKELEKQLTLEFRSSVTDLFAEIDGQTVEHLKCYFLQTDFFSLGPVTTGTVIGDLALGGGVPEGTELYPTLGAGYWLMLKELEPGDHTLHFGGSIDSDNPTIGQFQTETNVHLHVVDDSAVGAETHAAACASDFIF